jgi:hypothetical protein
MTHRTSSAMTVGPLTMKRYTALEAHDYTQAGNS